MTTSPATAQPPEPERAATSPATAQPPEPDDIAAAYRLIAARIRRTPTIELDLPSGGRVTLKLELLQHTGSFKPRGAFTTVLQAAHRPTTLVAASGGNHGLAVAHVGRELSIPAQIFVPASAPAAKVARLRSLGADVTQVGSTYAEAYAASRAAADAPGALGVHAYDAVPTLAGQGTIGLELSEQAPQTERLVVAIGGGGLLGGIASWYRPGAGVRLVGVEPTGSPTFHAALAAGGPVDIAPAGLASDALGASRIGQLPWLAMTRAGTESVLVTDRQIVAARELLWRELRLATEPGGAAALAAVLAGAVPLDRPTTVVVCGANADPAELPLD